MPLTTEVYEVERIDDMRERMGVREYIVKWKGYSENEKTWEPESNLDCPEIMAAFLKKHAAAKNKSKLNRRSTSNCSSPARKKQKINLTDKVSEVSGGFSRGLTAARISGCTDKHGEIEYQVHWSEEGERPELCKSTEVRKHCPDLIIDFLEKRIQFPPLEENQ